MTEITALPDAAPLTGAEYIPALQAGGAVKIPVSALPVIGDGTAATPGLRFAADQDTGFFRYGTNVLGLAAGGTIPALASAAGVGFGTLPSYRIDAQSETTSAAARFRTKDTAGTEIAIFARSDMAVTAKISIDPATGAVRFGTTTTHALQFLVDNSISGQITTNGNMLMGLPSSHGSGGRIQGGQSASGAAGACFTASATHAGYAYPMHFAGANRAADSSFSFFWGRSNEGVSADLEFNLRGDGNAYCDGSWTGGGADFAEYYEWVDGNPDAEDRRGLSVVLVAERIRPATEEDHADDIIGVISANPAVVGDGDIGRWKGKFLRDDFGSYVTEEYEVVSWTETSLVTAEVPEVPAYLGDDDVLVPEVPAAPAIFRLVEHGYAADAIPAGAIVPADAERSFQRRRALNPDYDPEVDYIAREDRPEWAWVGELGKLRLRKGQPAGTRWRKMRDISDAVEEWLVR